MKMESMAMIMILLLKLKRLNRLFLLTILSSFLFACSKVFQKLAGVLGTNKWILYMPILCVY